jgi:anthranilate synthase/aminodeoxychorismate synthase-like glutamine amidotransferase
MPLSVLFIDNFDSFVFNLVDEFERYGCAVDVWRNDIPVDTALSLAAAMSAPRLVVLSPGPGTPASAGNNMGIVEAAPADLPVFGVCLGYQSMVEALGGTVGGAPEIVHGKPSPIVHDGTGIFEGLPSPMTAGRYHSLMGTVIPEAFRVTARFGDIVMGIEHRERKVAGVQFHPESILTPYGGLMIKNVIRWAGQGDGDGPLEKK